jgi:hypothetical protein
MLAGACAFARYRDSTFRIGREFHCDSGNGGTSAGRVRCLCAMHDREMTRLFGLGLGGAFMIALVLRALAW